MAASHFIVDCFFSRHVKNVFPCVYFDQDFESNELEWEHREVELERTIVRLEKQQAEIASVASQV